MNIVAAAILLVFIQGCRQEQPEIINNGIEVKKVDTNEELKKALDLGQFDRAGELIKQAGGYTAEFIEICNAALRKRQLSVVDSMVSLALLKETQLKYSEAAEAWNEAGFTLPDDMEEKRNEYYAKSERAKEKQFALERERKGKAINDIDMNYVKSGLTEEEKQIADEMAATLKKLSTQFLLDIRHDKVVFPNQEKESFFPKLLDEIIKTRSK